MAIIKTSSVMCGAQWLCRLLDWGSGLKKTGKNSVLTDFLTLRPF